MPLLVLVRHGENDFVKTAKLAGRLPGVHLNQRGQTQAQAVAQTLSPLPVSAIYSSPLERAVETALPLAEAKNIPIVEIPALLDTDVGKWQGRSWKALAKLKAWKIVQAAPAQFTFPEGESFVHCQTRIVKALDNLLATHKKDDIIVAVFHADPIKLAIAHFIGLPLNSFQQLSIDTGSISALQINEMHTRLLWMNRLPSFDIPVPKTRIKK